MSYFDLYALDLPDEDIDDESPNDVLSCKFESDTITPDRARTFKSFIVSSGLSSSLFLRAYFICNLSSIDRIIVESSLFSTDKPHKVILEVFDLGHGILFVDCNSELDAREACAVVDLLRSNVFDAASGLTGLVLTSSFATHYSEVSSTAQAARTSTCLRHLCTSRFPRECLSGICPIAVPNVISQPLPAQLLTACEARSLPCALLVLYTDYAPLSVDTLSHFERALSAAKEPASPLHSLLAGRQLEQLLSDGRRELLRLLRLGGAHRTLGTEGNSARAMFS